LKEQLAAEKQQLAALLERYTEAYPDVIDAHAKISQLEAKLAELPPPPAARHVRALNLYQKQVDDLTAEESQIGEQLRINEREMSKLERRREDLSAQLHRLGGAGSPASPPPNIVASVPVGALPSGQQIRPFHILQSATMSVVVGTVKAGRFTPAVISMAGIGLVSLLFLFLVPRIPWNDMVITTAEELRKSLPAHVLYLGHVKGSEH
jgi:hypothetical protein